MAIRIAIPAPTSMDPEYNSRSLPPYISALQSSGASPIIIPLHESHYGEAKLLSCCQGVLLPGSRFDVDPERFGVVCFLQCGPEDPERSVVVVLLLLVVF